MKKSKILNMSNGRRFLLVIFLLVSIFFTSNLSPANSSIGDSKTQLLTSLIVLGSINITSDADFLIYPGIGTQLDPYTIEGYNITTSNSTGISITGTTKYFKIMDCYINADNQGIYIDSVPSGTALIYKNTFENVNTAIYLNNCSDSVVVENTCLNNDAYCVYLYESKNITVSDNLLNGNSDGTRGIEVLYSDDVKILKNTVLNNNIGIQIRYSDNPFISNNTCSNWYNINFYNSISATVKNNTCTNSYIGMNIARTDLSIITYNHFESSDSHAILFDSFSDSNIIHHNMFIDNNVGGSSQAWDHGVDNIWYDVKTNQGNYWSDLEGDTYYIEGGSEDPYPIGPDFDDSYENNDDFPTAKTIEGNEFYSLVAADDDYFKIYLTNEDRIEIDMSFDSSKIDLDLYFCAPNGYILASSNGTESLENIQYDVTYSDFHYIVVIFYSGTVGQSYLLSTAVFPHGIEDDIYEDNDYIEEPAAIEPEGVYNLIYCDVDIFLFQLEYGEYYTFSLDFDPSVIDLDFYLVTVDFDGDEDDIKAYSDSYSNTEEFFFVPAWEEADDFFYKLIILCYEDDSDITPSEYTLTITKGHDSTEETKMILVYSIMILLVLSTLLTFKRRIKLREL